MVKSYGAVNPLYVEVSEGENFIGNKIAFSITANVEDDIVNKTTGKVVEGKPGYDYEEWVWMMEYTSEGWRLDDIHEGSYNLAFAKIQNEIPETVKSSLGLAQGLTILTEINPNGTS